MIKEKRKKNNKKKENDRKEKGEEQKSTPKSEGKQGNFAHFTYPREESKFEPGPPCLQDRNEESPAHLYRSKKKKKKERVSVSP